MNVHGMETGLQALHIHTHKHNVALLAELAMTPDIASVYTANGVSNTLTVPRAVMGLAAGDNIDAFDRGDVYAVLNGVSRNPFLFSVEPGALPTPVVRPPDVLNAQAIPLLASEGESLYDLLRAGVAAHRQWAAVSVMRRPARPIEVADLALALALGEVRGLGHGVSSSAGRNSRAATTDPTA